VEKETDEETRTELYGIASRYGLRPSYLQSIVYMKAKGHRQNRIHEKTGYAQDTISRYCGVLREMDQGHFEKVLRAVAELGCETEQ
jgi:uncharacterized protein YerC